MRVAQFRLWAPCVPDFAYDFHEATDFMTEIYIFLTLLERCTLCLNRRVQQLELVATFGRCAADAGPAADYFCGR